MTEPLFITTEQVAALLGTTPTHLLATRDSLAENFGFPDPMPHSRRPYRWRRDRVLAWINEQGLPRAATAALPPLKSRGNVVLLEMARTA